MFARSVLRVLNSLFNIVLIVLLLALGSYSAYALWDNHQIIAAAENVQEDMISLKPSENSAQEGTEKEEGFQGLMRVNPDVCGWITMDNTNIDLPILQGEDNLTYINKDVYGEYALAGSIFLDSRNRREFDEAYALLYGHHMSDGKMFGDLDLYKDAGFFGKNKKGTLMLPGKTYDLEVLACLMVGASEDMIFEPHAVQNNIGALLEYVEANALQCNREALERVKANEGLQLLALSTCSSDFTDARTIVLTVMNPRTVDLGG